jgi:hypothetical protein
MHRSDNDAALSIQIVMRLEFVCRCWKRLAGRQGGRTRLGPIDRSPGCRRAIFRCTNCETSELADNELIDQRFSARTVPCRIETHCLAGVAAGALGLLCILIELCQQRMRAGVRGKVEQCQIGGLGSLIVALLTFAIGDFARCGDGHGSLSRRRTGDGDLRQCLLIGFACRDPLVGGLQDGSPQQARLGNGLWTIDQWRQQFQCGTGLVEDRQLAPRCLTWEAALQPRPVSDRPPAIQASVRSGGLIDRRGVLRDRGPESRR